MGTDCVREMPRNSQTHSSECALPVLFPFSPLWSLLSPPQYVQHVFLPLLLLEKNSCLSCQQFGERPAKGGFGNSRLAGKTYSTEKKIYIHTYICIYTHIYAYIHIHMRKKEWGRDPANKSTMWVCVYIFLAGPMWLYACTFYMISTYSPHPEHILSLNIWGHEIIPWDGSGKEAIGTRGHGLPATGLCGTHGVDHPSLGRCCFLHRHLNWCG